MILKMQSTAKKLQVVLSGSIYGEEACEIQESLDGYIDRGCHTISIDLSGIDYIDANGLGTLVAINKRATLKGIPLELKGLQGRVKKLFEMTRLDKLFDVRQ